MPISLPARLSSLLGMFVRQAHAIDNDGSHCRDDDHHVSKALDADA